MRVALVASLVSPLRAAEANGPHAVIVDLAHGLSARGHDVTVYAAEGSTAAGVRIVGVPVDAEASHATVRVGETPPAAAVAALNRGFERLFNRVRTDAPDAVSQHAFDAAAIDLAEGLPAIHTLHLPPLVDAVVASARATTGRIATVSEASRRAWEGAGVAGVVVLRNGVPRGVVADGPMPPVRPVAVIAGRISPEKGTDVAIRVARAAELTPLVVGDVYDATYFATAVEPILQRGEWIGPVPREALSDLMAAAALVLMPVRWDEPFGLVAAEAQMVGCPVAGYRRGALPEVVADGVSGWLVEPEDEAGLAVAARRWPELDRAAIRTRAEQEFDVGHMVSRYEDALTSVARGR